MISLASEAFRVMAISSGSQPKLPCQLAPDALDPRLQRLPHVDDRQLVGEPEVPDHLLQHVGRGGAAAAVVEVDHRAVAVEGPLDLGPVVLVVRLTGAGPRGCECPHSADRFGSEGREQRGAGDGGEEGPAALHVNPGGQRVSQSKVGAPYRQTAASSSLCGGNAVVKPGHGERCGGRSIPGPCHFSPLSFHHPHMASGYAGFDHGHHRQ